MPVKALLKDLLDFDPKLIKEIYNKRMEVALYPLTLQEVNDSISGL